MKTHLIFGVAVAIGALFLNWLLLGKTSPFDEYFLWHVGIRNFWRTLNAVPFIVGAIIGRSHAGPEPALFITLQIIQWFIIGCVLSILLKVLRRA